MTNHLPIRKFVKKEKQCFRLASFAPVFSPIAHLPKHGLSKLDDTLFNYVRVVDTKST
tara:strand:+ start:240 stop:413 length:174 start_codon:yes stop_codon:yes gene_type:complete